MRLTGLVVVQGIGPELRQAITDRVGQTPVPGGLIGSAGVEAAASISRVFVPTQPDYSGLIAIAVMIIAGLGLLLAWSLF